MSYLGEIVLKGLLEALPRPAPPALEADAAWESYIRKQFDSSRALFAKYPDWDVRDKRVLEIGCGTGGRAAYLATAGAKHVTAIDTNVEEIAVARRLCPALYPETLGRVDYLVSREDGAEDLGTFDVVLLIDVMEHVVSPPRILKLAYDYTAPGGRLYVSVVGWYHHMGSHTGLFPFINVVFSDETILNVIRWRVSRPDYVPTRFDSDPPIDRWIGIYDLRDRPGEHLNKLTIAELKKMMRYSRFRESRMKIVGFGHPHPLVRAVNVLRHVPVLQEACHSYVVVECIR